MLLNLLLMWDFTELGESLGIIILFIGYFLKEFKEWLDKKKKEKKDNIKNGIGNNINIYEKIVECRYKFSADRVAIIQFHNGDFYYSNNPILKCSMTHETTDVSIAKIMKDEQNVLVSRFPKFFSDLTLNDVVRYTNVQEMDTSDIVEELKFKGIVSFYAVKLYNEKKDIVGFLTLSYCDRMVGSISEKELINYAENITFLLRK